MTSFNKIPAKNKKGYKWECVKDGPLDPATGKRKQIRRRGETKEEAESRADAVLDNLVDNGIDEKKIKNLTFDIVALEWLEEYKRTGVSKNTIRLRNNSIKTINKYIEKSNIGKVNLAIIQKILNELFDQGLAKSTIEGVKVTANLIFEYAIKMKYRKDNPTTGTKITVRRRTVEEIESDPLKEKYLEGDEMTAFLDAVLKHGLDQDKEMFYLMAFSGLRIGEALALKWTDVNFETKRIRVTKTLYSENNNMRKYELLPPKTNGSIRDFEIDELVLKMLKSHQMMQKKIKLATRHLIEDYHDANFIFSHESGYPIVYKQAANRLARIFSKTKIDKHATSHIFRHSHISMLTEAGVDLATIMARVGHDDPKTTLTIYTHVTKKMEQVATSKLNQSHLDILKRAVYQGL